MTTIEITINKCFVVSNYSVPYQLIEFLGEGPRKSRVSCVRTTNNCSTGRGSWEQGNNRDNKNDRFFSDLSTYINLYTLKLINLSLTTCSVFQFNSYP